MASVVGVLPSTSLTHEKLPVMVALRSVPRLNLDDDASRDHDDALQPPAIEIVVGSHQPHITRFQRGLGCGEIRVVAIDERHYGIGIVQILIGDLEVLEIAGRRRWRSQGGRIAIVEPFVEISGPVL